VWSCIKPYYVFFSSVINRFPSYSALTATGIARSVSPGQGLRSVVYSPTAVSEVRSATPGRSDVSSWSSPVQPSVTSEQLSAQVGSSLPDFMDTS
jgi:hypothetical protein